MARKTKQDKFADALIARGERELPSRSQKFRTFTRERTASVQGYFYFLGRAGSLRVGRTVSRSVPVSDVTKRRLLGEKIADHPEGKASRNF